MAILPILQFEEKIVEIVEQNPVVVVIGETGSGKSTQLCQILHRKGFTKSGVVAVTQPRRVAAVSVARRVAQELGVRLGEEVGYGIRFEDRTSEKTRIKYLTDGVLLRESLSNPELNNYSVIILDEAHERSLNTDILLGLMKRLVKIRPSNLKVLVTSATLDGGKVSRFFSNCPVVTVPGKLFPVEILYSSESPKSYLESSLNTALDIHVREPEGDILIFVTGQDEIEKLVLKLEEKIQNLEEGSCMDAIVLPLHGYVIDSGYVKQRQYNPSTGMYSLDVVRISRVQADQRAGRAGRTRPGKCYRLYPSTIYWEELPEVTVPEIQRSSLAGSVLYLKSLDLLDVDILNFDFLDPPSRESLEDALKQLYLIDAIDENGSITQVGRTMGGNNKRHEKKRKHAPLELPDGSGLGDHIQLLQIYEHWDEAGYDSSWCMDHALQFHLGKLGSLEVQRSRGRKQSQQSYKNLRRALCVGFAGQLAERMIHHNGYRTIGFKPQLVQVHPSSVLKTDEDGRLPEFVVYHELVATTRPFMRNVCAIEQAWVMPILKKLNQLNVNKLSGGTNSAEIITNGQVTDLQNKDADTKAINDRDSKIQAARERYLARKTMK
ncbi:hypothetical protein Syun_024448 [Stephania yunnanensis]|uniref:Helicase ATP-binding domain-containing protein n=1 Tax=Stephania yunnanensis TaxID=152371 RepID=A0AAP0I4D7_9MAGN